MRGRKERSGRVSRPVINSAEYFDDIYTRSSLYNGKPENTPWYNVWVAVANHVKYSPYVADLGCGTGQFAEVLIKEGFSGFLWGSDISHKAIEICQKKNIPNSYFDSVDLREKISKSWNMIDKIYAYVCIEVLEHIDFDVELLRAIPHDALIIFTVPSYGGKSHLRSFQNEKEIKDRYSKYIKDLKIEKIQVDNATSEANPESFIFICRGTRNKVR